MTPIKHILLAHPNGITEDAFLSWHDANAAVRALPRRHRPYGVLVKWADGTVLKFEFMTADLLVQDCVPLTTAAYDSLYASCGYDFGPVSVQEGHA